MIKKPSRNHILSVLPQRNNILKGMYILFAGRTEEFLSNLSYILILKYHSRKVSM